MSNYLYIIDNGHGQETPGKESPFFVNGRRFLEFNFNRSVTRLICKELISQKISHALLVPEINDISLTKRVARANELQEGRKCIFISVHADAVKNIPNASGISVFYYNNSLEVGLPIAMILQKHLINKTGLRNRGVKGANFAVLRRTSMPAMLSENGFYSNYKECKLMMTESFQQDIAMAHVEAIKEIDLTFKY